MQPAAPAAPASRRLAVAYDPDAMSPLQLRESVGGICELIWIVDAALAPLGDMARVLGRLGTVADVTGLDLDEAAAVVGATEPDGVVCFSDRRLALVTGLAARLGLPGMSPQAAATVLGKFHQRAAFAAAGLEGPRTWRVEPGDPTALETAIAEATLPVVVKPEIGDGSRYVEAASDPARLRELLHSARDAARDTVVEELILGDPGINPEIADYISVESVVCGGVISHAALTGRLPVAPPFRETGFFMPASVDPAAERAALDLAAAAISALGIEVGCMHTEMKLTPDGPRLIEVNARLGGGMADMLSLIADVDLYEVAARLALGDHIVFAEPVRTAGAAYLFIVQPPMAAQRVAGIEGLDALGRVDGVRWVRVNRPVGDRLDWRDGRNNHVYSVLGVADGLEGVLDMARLASEKVDVSFE